SSITRPTGELDSGASLRTPVDLAVQYAIDSESRPPAHRGDVLVDAPHQVSEAVVLSQWIEERAPVRLLPSAPSCLPRPLQPTQGFILVAAGGVNESDLEGDRVIPVSGGKQAMVQLQGLVEQLLR